MHSFPNREKGRFPLASLQGCRRHLLGQDFFGAPKEPEQEKDCGQPNSEEDKSALAVKSSRQKSWINAGSQHGYGIDAQPILGYRKRDGNGHERGLPPG